MTSIGTPLEALANKRISPGRCFLRSNRWHAFQPCSRGGVGYLPLETHKKVSASQPRDSYTPWSCSFHCSAEMAPTQSLPLWPQQGSVISVCRAAGNAKPGSHCRHSVLQVRWARRQCHPVTTPAPIHLGTHWSKLCTIAKQILRSFSLTSPQVWHGCHCASAQVSLPC